MSDLLLSDWLYFNLASYQLESEQTIALKGFASSIHCNAINIYPVLTDKPSLISQVAEKTMLYYLGSRFLNNPSADLLLNI